MYKYTTDHYWPAKWASIVFLADVCRLSSSSVTLPEGGLTGHGRIVGRLRRRAGRVGGRAADTARRASTVTSR